MRHPEYLNITPAKTTIPDWYKKIPVANKEVDIWRSVTAKSCMPFFDSFTTGYTIPLPADINVVIGDDGLPNYSWRESQTQLIILRQITPGVTVLIPDEFFQQEPIWNGFFSIELPKGYSMLITHPLNRYDLPFVTRTGIVDDFKLHGGNLPFLLKKGFEGMLEAGTPIAQVIPFKRENWKLELSSGLYAEAAVNGARSANRLRGWYKNTYWKKKTYE